MDWALGMQRARELGLEEGVCSGRRLLQEHGHEGAHCKEQHKEREREREREMGRECSGICTKRNRGCGPHPRVVGPIQVIMMRLLLR
jgi:hypothetical protein